MYRNAVKAMLAALAGLAVVGSASVATAARRHVHRHNYQQVHRYYPVIPRYGRSYNVVPRYGRAYTWEDYMFDRAKGDDANER